MPREDERLTLWEGEGRPATTAEQLTAQFYEWEQRGRGWLVWPHRVGLEPPFRPFRFHWAAPNPGRDDGRRPTLLSSIGDALKRLAHGRDASPDDVTVCDEKGGSAIPDEDESPVTTLRLTVPPGLKVTQEAAEHLLLALPAGIAPVSFEVVGTEAAITIQFATREHQVERLRDLLATYFPEAVLREGDDALREFGTATEAGALVVDFGLSEECVLPLRTARGFEVDPLSGIVAALSSLHSQEIAALQVLFQPVRYSWTDSILRAVTDHEGKAFFADAPGMLALAREKTARPLFAAVVRIAATAPDERRAWQVARALGGALRVFENPTSNTLIPLENDDYDDADHLCDLLTRRSHRSGMLLNASELVSFVHLPAASLRAERLKRVDRKTRAAPTTATGDTGVLLGHNVHAGKTTPVMLSADQRTRHTYVVGASGTGKSTLLLSMILQDLEAGRGIAVLDPHGDLVDEILGRVPEHRVNDTVLLDPADAEYPVGFNVLSAHSDVERTLLSSDLVALFRRLSSSWGDQMNSVLANAILAFVESERGGTLLDLRRFLVEPAFRRDFLATVRDPEVAYYWTREFPLLKGTPQAPLLTRLDTFLRPRLIRHMVAQQERTLDLGAIMNEGKVLLAKLSMGAIGEENAYLLGTLLVAKMEQLALARQERAAEARRDFFLYVDEFHHFVTPSMATILSGARKYRLGLVLAHQDLRQLSSRDQDVLAAVLTNPYTRVCFRVGDFDAKRLEEGFSSFDAKDLQRLGTGQAICRVERSDFDFNLDTVPVGPIPATEAETRRRQVSAHSRATYARPRAEVEALLQQSAPAAALSPVERRDADSPSPVTAPVPALAEPRERSRVQSASATPLTITPALPSPGRGGGQHKYLQELVKRWADAHGWRSTIEESVLDGLGSVDVALRKGQRSLACEVSVTTEPEHELGNVRKCLAAGFEHVVVVAVEKKGFGRMRKAIEGALSNHERERVSLETPDGLFALLEMLDAQATVSEKTIRGYSIKVRSRPLSTGEQASRRQTISGVLAKALKRLKGAE